MNNTIDINAMMLAGGQKPCGVSYTLNNNQPVACTIIGDQPLFFMDIEEDEIADGDLDFFSYTNTATENSAEKQSGFCDFLMAGAEFAGYQQLSSSTDLQTLEQTLRSSRMGSALLDFAQKYDTTITHSDQVIDAAYDRASATIQIHPALDATDQVLLLSRELRRVWQHRNGALLNPASFHPDQAVLLNRVQVADASLTMVYIAWELNFTDHKMPWNRLESSSMADLARAFARECHMDFRKLYDGGALSAAFEAWFLSERCQREDRKLIQNMLAGQQDYVFDNAQAAQKITSEIILALGMMPTGKNYLAPYVGTIMTDSIFTNVRDRSSANFLWFIKFERSYREAEQELQAKHEDQDFGHDSHHTTNNKNNKNNTIRFGDHEKEHIIPLPQGRSKRGDVSASTHSEKSGTEGANVIALSQFKQARLDKQTRERG